MESARSPKRCSQSPNRPASPVVSYTFCNLDTCTPSEFASTLEVRSIEKGIEHLVNSYHKAILINEDVVRFDVGV